MSDTIVSSAPIVSDEAVVKPKRVLTEAQRLAFLKAREARARNIALRKEQKLAQEELAAAGEALLAPESADGGDALPSTVTERKPAAKRPRKPKAVKVVLTQAPPPEEIISTPPKDVSAPEPECPGAPVAPEPRYPHPEEYASMVADIIYKKLNAEELPMEPPPPKPKVKRARAAKTRPVAIPEVEENIPEMSASMVHEEPASRPAASLATSVFHWA